MENQDNFDKFCSPKRKRKGPQGSSKKLNTKELPNMTNDYESTKHTEIFFDKVNISLFDSPNSYEHQSRSSSQNVSFSRDENLTDELSNFQSDESMERLYSSINQDKIYQSLAPIDIKNKENAIDPNHSSSKFDTENDYHRIEGKLSGLNMGKIQPKVNSNIFETILNNDIIESHDGMSSIYGESYTPRFNETSVNSNLENQFKSPFQTPYTPYVDSKKPIDIEVNKFSKISEPLEKKLGISFTPKSNISHFEFADLGTPVLEVGSPSIIDDVDYSADDCNELSSSYIKTSFLDSENESNCKDKIKAVPLDSEIQNENLYSSFASATTSPDMSADTTINISQQNSSFENKINIHSIPRFTNLAYRHSPNNFDYSTSLDISRNSNVSDKSTIDSKQTKSKHLPLPDQSAFETKGDGLTSYGHKHSPKAPSPICPPTPVRTPLWGKNYREIILGNEKDAFDQIPKAPTLIRQNSLVDNKLLLEQWEDPSHSSVSFSKNYHNFGSIGSGTFADVFIVKQKDDDSVYYAIKKSKRQFRSKKDRDWLLNEVITMKQLGEHPCKYIVPFIRAWQEDSFFYFQIGLAEKGTLKDLIKDIIDSDLVVPDNTVWHVVHDVASGLNHIHSNGLVHLDIKPANLLITNDGIIQIGDYGMAATIGSKEDGHEGDTRYMAHELLNNNERLPSADIFSFGLTIYEICYSNEQLRSGWTSLPTGGSMWHDLREGKAIPLKDRPIELVELVKNLIAPNPPDRPSACDVLLLEEVRHVEFDSDETLLSAKSILNNIKCPNQRSSIPPLSLSQINTNLYDLEYPQESSMTPM